MPVKIRTFYNLKIFCANVAFPRWRNDWDVFAGKLDQSVVLVRTSFQLNAGKKVTENRRRDLIALASVFMIIVPCRSSVSQILVLSECDMGGWKQRTCSIGRLSESDGFRYLLRMAKTCVFKIWNLRILSVIRFRGWNEKNSSLNRISRSQIISSVANVTDKIQCCNHRSINYLCSD